MTGLGLNTLGASLSTPSNPLATEKKKRELAKRARRGIEKGKCRERREKEKERR